MLKKIERQAEASIPTNKGTFQMIAYARDKHDQMPHIVLLNPNSDFNNPINIRIHSECITGDLFGSKRCECGEQLDWSMNYINKYGGAIIYLRQEGRGIGIINKLHAYVKQDEGHNTAEANRILGFGYDDRTYDDAIKILEDLGITIINLLTNNPEKINALDKSGIKVLERVPVEIVPQKENLAYLKTKKDFFGHKLNID